MTTLFLESGTAATNDFVFYTSTVGAVSSSAAVTRSGNPYALLAQPASGSTAIAHWGFTAANQRLSVYVYFDQFCSSATAFDFLLVTDTAARAFTLAVDNVGLLYLYTGNVASGTLIGNGPTLGLNRWYRIAISHTITSATVYSVTVFVDGVSVISATNTPSLVTRVSPSPPVIGVLTSSALAQRLVCRFSDLYIDDSAAVTDPGDINVTTKFPATLNVNNWDTLNGSGTNRWDYIARASGTTNNIEESAGQAQATENFTLQTSQVGDISVSAGTLIARTDWVYAKKGTSAGPVKGTAQSVNNRGGGAVTSITTPAITTAVGDVIQLLGVDRIGSGTFVITDSLGNTVNIAPPAAGTNTVRMTPAYIVVAAGKSGSTTYIATFSSTSLATLLIAQPWTGLTATPIDVHPANANITATTAYAAPDSGTLAQANEVVISYYAAGVGAAFTAAGSTTGVDSANTSGTTSTACAGAIGYQIVNATTSITNQDATQTSSTGLTGIASFKASNSTATAAVKMTANGADTALVLTTSYALYTAITDSASYPSNAAGIGMKSSGAAAETFMALAGTLLAYKPLEPLRSFSLNQSVNRASTY